MNKTFKWIGIVLYFSLPLVTSLQKVAVNWDMWLYVAITAIGIKISMQLEDIIERLQK